VRRLKTILERIITGFKRHDYLTYLENIVTSINSSLNRTIKMRPVDVNSKNESEVWANMYERVISEKKPKHKCKVGQKVRISKAKVRFISNGYEQNWSEGVFLIKAVKTQLPLPVYILEDTNKEQLEGHFLEKEIHPIF
jgi:hypothetical protein